MNTGGKAIPRGQPPQFRQIVDKSSFSYIRDTVIECKVSKL